VALIVDLNAELMCGPSYGTRYAPATSKRSNEEKGEPMVDVTFQELDQRIAAIPDNIRELTEQAAAFSSVGDEARAAERIAEQERLLAALLEERVSPRRTDSVKERR
jgi:hypothetical protein